MTDLISRDDLRHQFHLLLGSKPFDCEPYQDGQYAGLRTALRIVDAMPEVNCECEKELPCMSSAT